MLKRSSASDGFRAPRNLTELRLWAPDATAITLHAHSGAGSLTVETVPLVHVDDAPGWWQPAESDIPERFRTQMPARYGFCLDGDSTPLPDPRATGLPDGVHKPGSAYTTPADAWCRDGYDDATWPGRAVTDAVLYELHIGTFSAEGTFAGAINHLDHLVDLGVSMVEVMPVNSFPGAHNWGYDGVGWYAVDETYGGPAGFVDFVLACHRRGLAVCLDVVYNHLGPSGNYLPRFGPYLSSGRNTWGESVNLDGPYSDPVREYIIDNALRWFDEFHIDALRLDAVHALIDHRAVHLLEEMATRTAELENRLGRPLSLIAESDLNDPRLISPTGIGGYGLTAQWNDDMHHVVHAAVSGERQGYYADFGSLGGLAKVLSRGFFHDGSYSSFRHRQHGRPLPTEHIAASALVAFTCNHDQIGNRALGDRPSSYLDGGQLAIKAALVMLSAFTPMLFMGEEWAARTPFQFFTAHTEPELGAATAAGRRAEFADHGWNSEDIPDPQAPSTFLDSKLDWSELDLPEHRRMFEFYRALLTLRRTHAELSASGFDSVRVSHSDDQTGWIVLWRGSFRVAAALREHAVIPTEELGVDDVRELRVELAWGQPQFTAAGVELPGHSVVVLRH
ncbi:malto-oligosyltrehalose trehalohydrolase [Gordonia effusa NBRC 100432]|uniref:Malto-oligosyltrehalose trehalohydrolase n=1 Tax=Gordonia effusa NBRC 100432 TaxID=1077974 RepID=H0R172_9ACTN|nr:malto-oligosyltrehalose trehalohydrolase [Gordonia effusa]GAB18823.1 malto-oligosyltrehalose trehalohydrolase [Gordonia effusa NBRC 100432]